MSLEPPALPEVTTAPSARLGPSESDFTPKARTPRLGLPLDQALALAAHNEANVSLDPELAPARGIRLRRPLGAICLTCKAPWPAGFARNPRLVLASPELLALILELAALTMAAQVGCSLTCVIRVGSSSACRSRSRSKPSCGFPRAEGMQGGAERAGARHKKKMKRV